MVAHFPALPQQQAAKIAELLGVRLAGRGIHRVILVVFDHDAGKADGVFLGQLHQVRPPDFGVKVRSAHAVIPADIGAIAARHRGGEIVQVEHRPVDNGVGRGVAQQAVGGRVHAPQHLIIDADVIHHHPAGAAGMLPHQRDALVPGAGIHGGILPEADTEGRLERVTELIPLPAAQHKVFRWDDAFHHLILPCRGLDPQLL